MSEVTQNNYSDWIRSEYRKMPDNKIAAMRSMIAVLAQSYEMLNVWREAYKEEYNADNARACAAVWHEFCRYYIASKVEVKLLIGTKLIEARDRLHDFSAQHNCKTFNYWLDDIQMLADTMFDGTKSRPYFSLVVACYNDGRYKEGQYLDRLLTSLCNQGILKQDLEVILSDDCSPVPFDDVVEKYKDRLNIVRTKTDHNYAPGNTRQKGVDVARGYWLCFADHDDKYYDNALRAVKTFIEYKHEKYYVYSPFNSVDPQGNVMTTYEDTMGWCHGKFYNMDHFWKAFIFTRRHRYMYASSLLLRQYERTCQE